MSNRRNFGLDIARSLAILLVLFSHGSLYFLSSLKVFTPAYQASGFLGVSLFFVLSGFLIGQIIIKDLVQGKSWASLLQFYIRRWMRTLPLYYLVLFVLFLFNSHLFTWEHLIFFQGISQSKDFFSVSWSLAVEEWFYLLVPPLILLFLKFWRGTKPSGILVFCFSFIVLSLLLRIAYVIAVRVPKPELQMDTYTLFRLDGIIPGVMLAVLKMYYQDIYYSLAKAKLTLISLIVGGMICFSFYSLFIPESVRLIVGRTILYTLVALYFVILILFLDTYFPTSRTTLQKKVEKIFVFISLTSYSVYLIHNSIYHTLYISLFQNSFTGSQLNEKSSLGQLALGGLAIIISLFITFTISAVLYYFYELPFLKLRDRFKTGEKTIAGELVAK